MWIPNLQMSRESKARVVPLPLTMDLLSPEKFRESLHKQSQEAHFGGKLKMASLEGHLALWTTALTACVVAACDDVGLRSSARGHKCELLPVKRSEYLALDVMAFAQGQNRWLFPAAVMELENSQQEDKIAYSLWKVLCVTAALRIVFCYRKDAAAAAPLIRRLKIEVVDAMVLEGRLNLLGRTVVAVGSRNNAETFPYDFFKWWELNSQTGRFESF
jgi:hypothetical protein